MKHCATLAIIIKVYDRVYRYEKSIDVHREKKMENSVNAKSNVNLNYLKKYKSIKKKRNKKQKRYLGVLTIFYSTYINSVEYVKNANYCVNYLKI